MKRTPWILASLAAFALTACGPRPNDNAAGSGAETGATADTAMTGAPSTPMDTGLAGTDTTSAGTTGATGADTAAH
jgi:hypothetical protein